VTCLKGEATMSNQKHRDKLSLQTPPPFQEYARLYRLRANCQCSPARALPPDTPPSSQPLSLQSPSCRPPTRASSPRSWPPSTSCTPWPSGRGLTPGSSPPRSGRTRRLWSGLCARLTTQHPRSSISLVGLQVCATLYGRACCLRSGKSPYLYLTLKSILRWRVPP